MDKQYCYLVPIRKLSCVSHRLNTMGLSFKWERVGGDEIAVIVPNLSKECYKELQSRLQLFD